MEDKTSTAKSKKKSIESEDKRELKIVLSFDLYFVGLMAEKRGLILPHHKAPMKKYAEAKGIIQGTKEEFDELFKVY